MSIVHKNDVIKTLKSQLVNRDRSIRILNEGAAASKKTIERIEEELFKQIEKHGSIIESLEREVKRLRQECNGANSQASTYFARCSELQKLLIECRTAVAPFAVKAIVLPKSDDGGVAFPFEVRDFRQIASLYKKLTSLGE